MRWCRVCTGAQRWKHLVCTGEMISSKKNIPDDRADDLEQLMREEFKVKTCERIGPGFLTSTEFPAHESGMERWRFLLHARSETHTGNG